MQLVAVQVLKTAAPQQREHQRTAVRRYRKGVDDPILVGETAQGLDTLQVDKVTGQLARAVRGVLGQKNAFAIGRVARVVDPLTAGKPLDAALEAVVLVRVAAHKILAGTAFAGKQQIAPV